MKDDKILIIDYFNFKSIEARHYPKKGKGEKPDFELFIKDNLFGFCELKSIIDYEFSGLRNDPTYNKIQAKIHKSSKQFKSVNSSHNYPNIVFFINHYQNVGFQDLWYVLTGMPTPPNQSSDPIDLRYLKRLLNKDDLSLIDLFIWADTFGDKILYVINSDSEFLEKLKESISSKEYEKINIKNLT